MITVGRTRRCIDEALDAGVARRDQHVQESVDVGASWSPRIGQRARYRPQRRLMQHEIDAGGRPRAQAARSRMSAFDEFEARHCSGSPAPHLVEVAPMAGGEVIEGRPRADRARSSASIRCEPMNPALPGHQPARRTSASRSQRRRRRRKDASREPHRRQTDTLRTQRGLVELHLTSASTPPGCSLPTKSAERPLLATGGAPTAATMAAALGRSFQACQRYAVLVLELRSASATGSCTSTSTP
jgi:hypothetical protein